MAVRPLPAMRPAQQLNLQARWLVVVFLKLVINAGGIFGLSFIFPGQQTLVKVRPRNPFTNWSFAILSTSSSGNRFAVRLLALTSRCRLPQKHWRTKMVKRRSRVHAKLGKQCVRSLSNLASRGYC